MIDPHVHCRDGKQSYKETIEHCLKLAHLQGIEKIFDMPNTDPPIIYEKDVKARIKLIPKTEFKNYFLYLGLTSKKEQIKSAVRLYYKYKKIIGFKLFAGKSVGDLAVIDEKNQEKIYRVISQLGYKGVLAVHCEKEKFIDLKKFNPKIPITWSYARPCKAEIESIKDQIKFAKKYKFKGILHICHISCSKSIEIIKNARKEIKITCGITPHHIMWDNKMLKRNDGLLYKMNPPLRNKKEVKKLIEYLKNGDIDFIESDHAPHQIGEKLFSPFLSGFPSLYLYKDFIKKFLPKIGVSKNLIQKMTFDNIIKVYGIS